MIVRCGACRAQFEVSGEGTYACPACGTHNAIRRQGGPPPPDAAGGPVVPGSGPEPRPEAPSPRVTCGECGFGFIVGDVETAPCPNCGAPVPVAEEGP